MDLEKLPQEDIVSEKEEPSEDVPAEVEIPAGSQEKLHAYLDFSDSEKAEVIRRITERFSSQGHDVEGKQIDFPKGQEEIESWVNGYAQHFETKRLTEAALKNSEFAPNLTKEITNRKEYAHLEQILQHYKGKPMFEYCVRKIESSLKGDEMQNSILMALSEAMAKTEERQESTKIAEHELDMKKEKKTARPLAEYQRLLKISDDELQALSGKELLLVGGGFSPIKGELDKRGIDCTVTNIDPIAESDPEIADDVRKGDFYETEIAENRFDEIMGLHSLPTYAFTPEQVKNFYSRSILSLKQGGTLRVTPVEKFSDAFTPSMRLSRKPVNNASAEFVASLKERPDLFTLTGFTIEHKGALGKKTEMPGVKIEIVGDKDQVKEYLESKK
ncbi:MAG: hypothetical protein U9M94_01325 [Patescibacteria group bacterium]|nr:hypothetical protein [Patescibacteria group bacterium]